MAAPKKNSTVEEGETKDPVAINVEALLAKKDEAIAELKAMYESAVESNKQLEAARNTGGSEMESLRAEVIQAREKLVNYELLVREKASLQERLDGYQNSIAIEVKNKPHKIVPQAFQSGPLKINTVYEVDFDGDDSKEKAKVLLLTANTPNSTTVILTYRGENFLIDGCTIRKDHESNRIVLERVQLR